MKNSVRKNIAQALLLLALTAFALWFALKDDAKSVLFHLQHISIRWFLVGVVLGILYYVIQGLVLFMIAKGYKKDIKVIDGVHNAYVAAFFNGVTPLGGGQVAQTYAFRKLGIAYSDIASILWKDFFLYQSMVLLYVSVLFIAGYSYAFDHFHGYMIFIIAGFLVNASVILILWTMAKFPKLYVKISNLLVSLLHRIHIVKNKAYTLEKWQGQVVYFNQEISKLKNEKKLVIKVIFLNFIRQTIFYSLPYVAAIALGIPMQWQDLCYVIIMSSFIHMLNALTPLPGDTGWTESAFIVIFAVMFGKIQASSVMIVWRFVTYHINLIIGGSVFLYIKSRKKLPLKEDKEATTSEKKKIIEEGI